MSGTMKAWRFNSVGGPLESVNVPIPKPGPHQVRIKVLTCGICHTDAGIKYGGMGQSLPRIPGHEVAGIIDEVGPEVGSGLTKGDYVGVGWFAENCERCFNCKKNVWVCCQNIKATGDHVDGGYAEYMIANERGVAKVPQGLDPIEAGPLMCAGLTTFNALRNSGAVAGDIVVIQGVGGLGHFGVQWARKMGFYTIAVSRGADKVKLATDLGAHLSLDSTKQDIIKEIQALGGARVILATAPSGKAVEELIPALGLNGVLLIVSVIMEDLKVKSLQLLRVNGSIKVFSSGDSRDIVDTLKFAKDFGVKPMVEVFPFDKAPEAFERMLSNQAKFRVVLEVSKL